MSRKQILARAALVVLALALILAFVGYRYVVGGGMRARQEPSAIEGFLAGKLVTLGIPSSDHGRANPLASAVTSDDVAAGRDLYQAHCDLCHGHDGAGKTAAGGGMYPPPARLQSDALAKRTDGDLFYLIRNGIRNTAMPGWQLPDRETWQLVLYVRKLPLTVDVSASKPAVEPQAPGALH